MKNNAFLAAVKSEVERRLSYERIMTVKICKDAADMAANEVFSMGESRVPAWDEAFSRYLNAITNMAKEDAKTDRSMWYSKEKRDQTLKRIRGKFFETWEVHYASW